MKARFAVSILASLAALILAPADSAQSLPPLVPEELIILRSQPSVFKLLAVGAGTVSHPQRTILDRALLDRDYAAQPAGSISKAAFIWERLATAPEKYLQPSPEMTTFDFSDQPYASGSGFAVSKEGILITNAHVLEPPDLGARKVSPIAADLLGAPLQALAQDLLRGIGEAPAEDAVALVEQSLVKWMLTHSKITGRMQEIRIVLGYGVDMTKLEEVQLHPFHKTDRLALPTPFDFTKPTPAPLYVDKTTPRTFPNGLPRARQLFELPKPQAITRNTKVLAVGASYPGEDVAVLQVLLDRDDKPPFGEDHPQLNRLICLPLGDSDLVLPGAGIHALGFPAKAFDPQVMDPSAQFRSSNRPGEISQTKRIRGGWDAFEMAAEIDHGDSGGPVIDKSGDVVAINVSGIPGEVEGTLLAGHKLAVPINLAKKYLAKAGIVPDRGEPGRLWDIALRCYSAKKYSEARGELSEIRTKQEGLGSRYKTALSFGVNVPVKFNSPFISPYLSQFEKMCDHAEASKK